MTMLAAMLAAAQRLLGYYNGDEKTAQNPGGLTGVGGMADNWDPCIQDIGTVANGVGEIAGAMAAAQSVVVLKWDAATLVAAPAAGTLRATTAAPAVGSYSLLVSVTDAAGTGIGDMLTDLGASSSAAKARARLVKVGDAGKYLDLQVTGVSGSGAYRTVAVACIGGPGGFAAGDTVAIGWTRTGDKGDVGGASLPPGSVAAPGLAVMGDSNTGIAQVGGADTLSAVVAAIESMRWVPGAVHLNPGRAAYNPAIWLMGPSAGEDYSVQRDAATGYLVLNGLQTAASGYSIRVNNGTERLRIPNTGPIELEATKFRGPATAKQGAIAYAATLTLDFATYQDFAVGDLTGPLTLANPSTYPVGQRGEILLHEDATGGRTVSFGANWIKMGNGTVNTAAGKYSVITYWIVSSSVIIYSIAGGA
ncbi:hypothetical protein ABMY26_22675 [Azospirillum sp. HJ39]|uniref:hypothetical protein n=1 Tax=Azospirillum sp. HJ39 TaxID=3159496 RepID=UPI003555F0A6